MVNRGFICGVMVSVLANSVVDRGFICGIMVSVLAKSVVDRMKYRGYKSIKENCMRPWVLIPEDNRYSTVT